MKIKPNTKKIKRWREERGWSQEHLAELAGISLRTIQRIENGDPAARDSVMALAAAFNVDVSTLSVDASLQAKERMDQKAAKANAGIRLSFGIHLASWVFGMILFAGISLSDGSGYYTMLAPSLWWTIGLAGHALAVAIVALVTHYERSA